jgi:hypothetical protein
MIDSWCNVVVTLCCGGDVRKVGWCCLPSASRGVPQKMGIHMSLAVGHVFPHEVPPKPDSNLIFAGSVLVSSSCFDLS